MLGALSGTGTLKTCWFLGSSIGNTSKRVDLSDKLQMFSAGPAENLTLNATEAGSEGQQVNSVVVINGANLKGWESLTVATGSTKIPTRAVKHQILQPSSLGDTWSWELLLCLSLITGSVPSQGRQREGPDLPFISQVLLALLLGPLQRNPVRKLLIISSELQTTVLRAAFDAAPPRLMPGGQFVDLWTVVTRPLSGRLESSLRSLRSIPNPAALLLPGGRWISTDHVTPVLASPPWLPFNRSATGETPFLNGLSSVILAAIQGFVTVVG